MSALSPVPNPAETYEQYLVPAMFAPMAVKLVARAAPHAGEHVLDLACGTGIVARRVAPLVTPDGHVDALDLNPVMLSEARNAAAREEVEIAFHDGNMEAVPFPDDAYDLVTCHQGLQFAPNRPTAVSEMRRVLAAGGRVVVGCWGALADQPLSAKLAPIIAQHVGAPVFDVPFSLGDVDELRALFIAAGFSDVQLETVSHTTRFPHPDRYVAMLVDGIIAGIPSMQQLSPEARQQLVAALRVDIDPVVRDATVGGEIVSPMQTHIVTAR